MDIQASSNLCYGHCVLQLPCMVAKRFATNESHAQTSEGSLYINLTYDH